MLMLLHRYFTVLCEPYKYPYLLLDTLCLRCRSSCTVLFDLMYVDDVYVAPHLTVPV